MGHPKKQLAEEFVSSVADFGSLSPAAQIPYLIYYLVHIDFGECASVSTIADLRAKLHLPAFSSLPNHLSDAVKNRKGRQAKYVKVPGGYVLERNLRLRIDAEVSGRPAAVKIAADLHAALATVMNPAVKDYLEEAVGCFESKLNRAAIVFAWCAAYSVFRQWLFDHHLATLNAQMATWKKPASVATIEDFEDHNEASIVDTARAASIVKKEQHKTLKRLLDERNSFAHPTLKKGSPSRTEAFIETVLEDVVSVFV